MKNYLLTFLLGWSFFLPLSIYGQDKKVEPLKVIASFSILKDIIEKVGKDNVVVEGIVGPNSDTHIYEPTPQDAKKLAHADLVFINGLGFEGWIDRLIEASGYEGNVIKVTENITPLHDHSHCKCKKEGHHLDPHVWHSIQNVMRYVDTIMEAFIQKDPQHEKVYRQNAEEYKKNLEELHKELKKRFAHIPKEKRVIVTTHEGFGYLGSAYDITFLSPVGVSTEAEPSPKTLASIIKEIKRLGIKTIFAENITSPKLMEQLSQETGAKVGPVVYSDALSDKDGPASTYLEMMTYNAEKFLESLMQAK